MRIGAEATGNFRWLRHLVAELAHEFLLGDACAIRASCPRKQRTDKRSARHILSLLVEDQFPVVWQPPVENDELRQLLLHRCRLVRMRTRIKNQLDSMAKDEGLLSLIFRLLHDLAQRGISAHKVIYINRYKRLRKCTAMHGNARNSSRNRHQNRHQKIIQNIHANDPSANPEKTLLQRQKE